MAHGAPEYRAWAQRPGERYPVPATYAASTPQVVIPLQPPRPDLLRAQHPTHDPTGYVDGAFSDQFRNFNPHQNVPPVPSEQTSIAAPPAPIPQDITIDYRLLLLHLADQYISQARALAPTVKYSSLNDELDRYHKLMATGLACIETVIKKQSWSLTPRQQATLELRYANILLDETDNDTELETLLSRGIQFCDKNRLTDIKYGMQYLLARTVAKIRPQAALNNLEASIRDAIASQHIAWIYAFRSLRISLLVSTRNSRSTRAVLDELSAMSQLAQQRGDRGVLCISSLFEAIVHLNSAEAGALEDAGVALAQARAMKGQEASLDIPQLQVLELFVDLALCLTRQANSQTMLKMDALQQYLDQIFTHIFIPKDGSFKIVLNSASADKSTAESGGIIGSDSRGFACLNFSWLSKSDVFALAFLLSAVASSQNDAADRKTEDYIREGIKMVQEDYLQMNAAPNISLKQTHLRMGWGKYVKCHMLIQQVLVQIQRSKWSLALSTFKELERLLEEQQQGSADQSSLELFALYLKAVTKHSLGDTEDALQIYCDPRLSLEVDASRTSPLSNVLAALAALNVLMIIRQPKHHLHDQAASYSNGLDRFLKETHRIPNNTHIQAAHEFVHASYCSISLETRLAQDGTRVILPLKQHLQRALHIAKDCHNSQILTLVMSYMHFAFFQGSTDEQAIQSAKASRQAAKDAGSRLWLCVGDTLYANTLEKEGKAENAATLWKEAYGLAKTLPPTVVASLENTG